MDLREPFYPAGDHIGIDLPGARAVFTTRRGGHSTGPYESMNLGVLTGDERPVVLSNRATLADQLGVGLVFGRQVHGDRVATATRAGDFSDALQVDGHATVAAGVAPLVFTADCLPIAVAGQGAVAMLHAGWRGLAAGVITKGVRVMRELGADGALRAAIGPGAGVCCYEVGEEVHAELAHAGPAARDGRNADLKAVARRLLIEAGVEQVDDVGLCTICDPHGLFFSHRREHGVTGRQAGIAWLT
jgi:YfiH family protein